MKSIFHLEPPQGFRGLSPHEEVTIYTRHLPHWRQRGATYFVTFRLGDSLPQTRLAELRALRRKWETEIGEARAGGGISADDERTAWERLAKMTFEKAERWLDEGSGSCVLGDPRNRKILVEMLHHFDGDRYELGCYVVMPNHVHLIIRPLGMHELESILQGRKRLSALEINRISRRSGTLWQEESFDRIIRDPEHLWDCVQYIGRNPRLGRLAEGQYTRWIRPEWSVLGWDFDEPGRS